MSFDFFIAVDWSGDKESLQRSLYVAICGNTDNPPRILHNPYRKDGIWSRSDLTKMINSVWIPDQMTLIGFDFAFAFPYNDKQSYFPDGSSSFQNAYDLWKEIEKICEGDDNFYGGSFYSQNPIYSKYFLVQNQRGKNFDGKRKRKTEAVCLKNIKTNPESPFKCIGAAQVGPGSVSGMRLLNHFHKVNPESPIIWPFQKLKDYTTTFIEIFPRIYYLGANEKPSKRIDYDVINKILAKYHSKPLSKNHIVKSKDEADAIISAAAIRYFSKYDKYWNPEHMNDIARRYEGWIFGV